MLGEVINAVFVTFLGSEWLASEAASDAGKESRRSRAVIRKLALGVMAMNVCLVKLDAAWVATLERRWQALCSSPAVVSALEGALCAATVVGVRSRCGGGGGASPAVAAALFLGSWAACAVAGGRATAHAPKVVLAAVCFAAALHRDAGHRRGRTLPAAVFLRALLKAALFVAPCYPILAVAISLVFLVLISLFEAVGLPVRLLNDPLYFGCIYGPFAAVYVEAKKALLAAHASLELPTTVDADLASRAKAAAIMRRQAEQQCAEPW